MINCLLALEYIFGFISDQCSYFPFNLFALKITGVAVSYFNIPARNSIVEFSNPMHIRPVITRLNPICWCNETRHSALMLMMCILLQKNLKVTVHPNEYSF